MWNRLLNIFRRMVIGYPVTCPRCEKVHDVHESLRSRQFTLVCNKCKHQFEVSPRAGFTSTYRLTKIVAKNK